MHAGLEQPRGRPWTPLVHPDDHPFRQYEVACKLCKTWEIPMQQLTKERLKRGVDDAGVLVLDAHEPELLHVPL